MQPPLPHADPVTGLLLTAIAIAVAAIAVSRSLRKWRTAGHIVLCGFGGFVFGGVVAVVFHNAKAGGALAALLTQLAIIAASIERLRAAKLGRSTAQ